MLWICILVDYLALKDKDIDVPRVNGSMNLPSFDSGPAVVSEFEASETNLGLMLSNLKMIVPLED